MKCRIISKIKVILLFTAAIAVSCAVLCGCSKYDGKLDGDGAEIPANESPPWLLWNDSFYWMNSSALPAEKWGVELSDLERVGETIEAESGRQLLEQNGQAYFVKSGCPIFQGEEGTLYIEVEPGLFWQAEFRETVAEYYERWSHVESGQNP